MTEFSPGYWEALSESFDRALLAELQKRFNTTDPVTLSADELYSEVDSTIEEAQKLLERLVQDQLLTFKDTRSCPHCHQPLREEDVAHLLCTCGEPLQEDNLPPVIRSYHREGHRSRDVRWMLAIHGMNTTGQWQESFNLRLAQAYGYSIPVALYKYGNIKLAPFLSFRQVAHRDRLIQYIRDRREEMRIHNGDRPDVIAHSFGTWLLAHALLADKSDDPIKLGRVILTGSIVRPDFTWSTLLQNGRVQAVMCHYGGRDIPVCVAHFFIPDSGPSGRVGFNDQSNVIHRFEAAFAHSDYFTPENLPRILSDRWAPFLTRPLETFKDWRDRPTGLAARPWTGSHWRVFTYIVKLVVLALLLLTSIAVLAAVPIGLYRIFKFFR